MRAKFLLLLVVLSVSVQAELDSINPKVKAVVDGVSDERIAAILKRLESFGTRHTLSNTDDPEKGIGAARNWILKELKSYSPRLEARLDLYRVKKQGRLPRDVEMANVIAVLPGTVNKDRQIIISAHYDSLNLGRRLTEEERRALGDQQPQPADPNIVAPGVTDDGSGTAAVMELARVMSQMEFEKTIVFALFVAEEQQLYGSTLHAAQAKKDGVQIEAVLNNDIIGSDVSGNGSANNREVRVFSEDPSDSTSREVARYIKNVGERYVPSMRVELVFRADRWGRGGDHTPFNLEGYAAVRMSSAEENYANQHTATDTFANTSVPYITKVTKVNGAALASLALAPKNPVTVETVQRGERRGAPTAMLARGRSRYDAQLRWKNENPEADLAGYVVLMRSTTAPYWERRVFVGKVNEYLLPDVSIDEYSFGVQAVDTEGNSSLASQYGMPTRQKRTVELY